MIPDINLLPKYERQNIVLYRIFIISLIVVLLTFIGLTYTYFHTKANISKMAEENELLVEQQTLLEAQLANAGSNKPESLEAVVNFAEEQVIPTSVLIEELNNLLPNNAHLTTYDYVPGLVEIESLFETKSDASTYIIHLLESNYMNDVRIDQIETIELIGTEPGDESVTDYKQNVRYFLDINLAELKKGAKLDE